MRGFVGIIAWPWLRCVRYFNGIYTKVVSSSASPFLAVHSTKNAESLEHKIKPVPAFLSWVDSPDRTEPQTLSHNSMNTQRVAAQWCNTKGLVGWESLDY